MAPVTFHPDPKFYRNHYNQRGGSHFSGTRYQKGYGLGGILAGFFKSILPAIGRHVVPLLKSGAKAVGRHALEAGTEVLEDTLRGKPLKQAVRKRTSQHLSNLAEGALKAVSGSPKVKKQKIRKKKNRRKDIFD